MARLSLAAALLLACITYAYGQQGTVCAWNAGGKPYNFGGLKKPTDSNYGAFLGKGTANGISYTYRWNFCGPVFYNNPPCGNNGDSGDMMAFQIKDDDQSCTPIGRVTEAPTFEAISNGVQLTYINNVDMCRSGSTPRRARFTITCDPSTEWSTVGDIQEDDSTICQYDVNAKSKYACPAENELQKIGGGWIFVIIFFGILVLYLVVGIIIKWRMGSTGPEMIPNFEFWKDLPSLVLDGFGFLRSKVTGYSRV